MIQYVPDTIQWFLLTIAPTLAVLLIPLGIVLLAIFLVRSQWNGTDVEVEEDRKGWRSNRNLILFAVPGILIIALGALLPTFGNPTALGDRAAQEISETASFDDVRLLHIETVALSPFTQPSIRYIGTGTDLDGNPRQFRYTQYGAFGIYEMIGFDRPETNLRVEPPLSPSPVAPSSQRKGKRYLQGHCRGNHCRRLQLSPVAQRGT